MNENDPLHRCQVTGVVLAGGRGQRMGGADKGLAEWQGRPLVAHILERLAPQVADVMINANRNREVYAQFGYPVIADVAENFPGPLAGLQAALRNSTRPWVMTVPCDAPLFPLDLVERLLASLADGRANVAVARTADGLQPVFCLANQAALASLEGFLASGGHRVGAWLDQVQAHNVDFADAAAFVNLNTLADLEQAVPK